MSVKESAPLQSGVGAYVKKAVAWLIYHLANFLNTLLGRCCALGFLLCVIAASIYWAHIILYPILISIFGALWRKILLTVVWRRLSSRKRRWIRDHAKLCSMLLKRKWGVIPFWWRVAIKCALGAAAGMLLLHWLHFWNMAAWVSAILPVPLFVEIYLGQKLPRILVAFVQRQGLGKIVFDGGWHLVPVDMRPNLKRVDRTMTKFIKRPNTEGTRRWHETLDRLERRRAYKQMLCEQQQEEKEKLERELAALD